jgi:hypothetical protein
MVSSACPRVKYKLEIAVMRRATRIPHARETCRANLVKFFGDISANFAWIFLVFALHTKRKSQRQKHAKQYYRAPVHGSGCSVREKHMISACTVEHERPVSSDVFAPKSKIIRGIFSLVGVCQSTQCTIE